MNFAFLNYLSTFTWIETFICSLSDIAYNPTVDFLLQKKQLQKGLHSAILLLNSFIFYPIITTDISFCGYCNLFLLGVFKARRRILQKLLHQRNNHVSETQLNPKERIPLRTLMIMMTMMMKSKVHYITRDSWVTGKRIVWYLNFFQFSVLINNHSLTMIFNRQC